MTMAFVRAEKAIAAWKDAYRRINLKEPPVVTYHAGWIKIWGSVNERVRISQLEAMAERLNARMADLTDK